MTGTAKRFTPLDSLSSRIRSAAKSGLRTWSALAALLLWTATAHAAPTQVFDPFWLSFGADWTTTSVTGLPSVSDTVTWGGGNPDVTVTIESSEDWTNGGLYPGAATLGVPLAGADAFSYLTWTLAENSAPAHSFTVTLDFAAPISGTDFALNFGGTFLGRVTEIDAFLGAAPVSTANWALTSWDFNELNPGTMIGTPALWNGATGTLTGQNVIETDNPTPQSFLQFDAGTTLDRIVLTDNIPADLGQLGSFASGGTLSMFSAVPEPSGLALAAFGLAALTAWRWRRRRELSRPRLEPRSS